MNRIDRLYMEMIRYYQGDPKHIQHFVKVHSFSRLIGQGEGLDEDTMYILEAAALVHDIGIKVGMEKYGRSDGKVIQKSDSCSSSLFHENTESIIKKFHRLPSVVLWLGNFAHHRR